METTGSPIPEIPFAAPAAKKEVAMPVVNKISMRRLPPAFCCVSMPDRGHGQDAHGPSTIASAMAALSTRDLGVLANFGAHQLGLKASLVEEIASPPSLLPQFPLEAR